LSAPENILYIGHVWPEPNSSAAGRRTLSLIRCLQAAGGRVTFACAAALSEHRYPLSDIAVDEVEIRLNCDSFNQLLRKMQPDLVVFDRFLTEEQFSWRVAKECPQAMCVLDTQDLHCLRDARHQALKRGQNTMRPDSELLSSELALRELASIWRCDLSLMISTAEISLLQSHYGVSAELLHHLPFSSEGGTASPLPYAQRRHFICIGNFRHEPNWDSLRYLRSELWPEIRRKLPSAQCHVYGAYPPPKAQQLHSEKQGFLLKGWAKDAAAVMRQARICIAPLRFGAGQKGKLLEAMEQATPSVTTSIGAEGMVDTPANWGGVVADSPQALIEAAVSLYRDESNWRSAQERAVRCLAPFTSAEPSQALQSRIGRLSDELAVHRQGNFIGAMLRHHSLRSHQYMSQWIAAKSQLATAH